MLAARLSRRGGPEQIVLERVGLPYRRPSDALVAVRAAAITPSELEWVPTWTREDGTERSPIIPSHEVMGTIEAVDPGFAGPPLGARVFGLTDFYRDGGAAEFVAVRADDLAEWPASLDPVLAAALPLSGLTAWQALFDHGHLVAGERVLIHGAAGGVGSFAVQLAHLQGAHVIAVTSGRDLEFARNLGADIVIDRDDPTLDPGMSPVDLIIDTVGGQVLERSWPLLADDGRMVSIAPSSRAIAERDPRGRFFIVVPDRAELVELAQLVEAGRLRVIVERTFSLAETREAYEFGLRQHPRGKVVIRVRE
jgi:NADPH:quinone reductase-like Zn-dependent oxidoreductase